MQFYSTFIVRLDYSISHSWHNIIDVANIPDPRSNLRGVELTSNIPQASRYNFQTYKAFIGASIYYLTGIALFRWRFFTCLLFQSNIDIRSRRLFKLVASMSEDRYMIKDYNKKTNLQIYSSFLA